MRSSLCRYIFKGLDPTEVFGDIYYTNETSMIVLKAMFEIGFIEHKIYSNDHVNLTKGTPCLFQHEDTIKIARILSEVAEEIKQKKHSNMKYRPDADHFTTVENEQMHWIAETELYELVEFLNCSGGFEFTNTGSMAKAISSLGYCPVTKNVSWKPEATKQTNTIQRESTKELVVD